ncbi:MAG TPA: hypothetical protein VL593_07210 [Ramlibacter sp.]|jgi:hypothetical protein|nr:hypothetical protein [Ramlibacter sp.]
MAAVAFMRIVMFAVRVMPGPVHRALDAWAQRQASMRRKRRLSQLGH